MKVLIVEDDPTTQMLLRLTLKDRGHQVVTCDAAEDAIPAYQSDSFAMIVLDLNLPGMDGLQYCRWVRNQPDGDRSFILIGTGRDQPQDLQQALLAGCNDFLLKPYERMKLMIRLSIAERQVAIMAERRRAEELLRRSQERLEVRVRDRTAELAQANESLLQEIAERKKIEAEREKLIADLQAALVKVKTMRGLLPICSWCHKIRDDSGYWNQLEVFLGDHSDLDFSHSICPDCSNKFRSEFQRPADSKEASGL
jgi:DNA-binding response OmpR family regulator